MPAKVYTLKVPKTLEAQCSADESFPVYIADLVEQAIRHDTAPGHWTPDEPLTQVPVRLSAAMLARAKALLGRAPTAEDLSQRAWGCTVPAEATSTAETLLAEPPAAEGTTLEQPSRKVAALANGAGAEFGRAFAGRPQQKAFYEQIRQALEQHNAPVILAEGGTGLGKGRVIAALAAQPRDAPVVVAAPTIQILGQLLSEWHQLTGRTAACYLGSDAFVRQRMVEEVLAEADVSDPEIQQEVQAVRDWIASGAGCAGPTTRAFHDADPHIAWLHEDLEQLSPGVADAGVRLTRQHARGEDQDDAGAMAYQAMRARVRENETLVFATHSALVWNARSNGSMLPEYEHLILDEAHQFASVAESAFSRTIAFRTLIKILGDEGIWKPHRALTQARTARASLRTIMETLRNQSSQIEAIARKGSLALCEHLGQSAAELIDALEPLNQKSDSSVPEVAEALAMAKAIVKRSEIVSMSFSPKFAYPTLTSGPRSLRGFFETFWKRLSTATLASATIYLPKMDGDRSHFLLQISLHLPPARVVALPPVAPKWLYQVPVFLPQSDEDKRRYTPPQEGQQDAGDDGEALYQMALSLWYEALTERLQAIHASAAGGVLVLLSSYEHIEALGERLQPQLEERLIVQQRGRFRGARATFLRLAQENKHALWLAAGPAWTGNDLNAATCLDAGIAAKDDVLLSDLVIPRIPFGTEHSSVHVNRKQRLRTAERDTAAFRFRQGLGRLIRRPGLPRRRIWVLDARLWNSDQPWLYGPFRRLLERYDNQQPLPPLPREKRHAA